MVAKSVVTEGRQIRLATELIGLGARLQVLEAETTLSRERLIKLYKELKGVSPPKGMLPFSTDWFVTWQPNIHASLFIDIYQYLIINTGVRGIEALIKAFRLYLEHVESQGHEPMLSLTRTWMLLRYFESKLLQTTPCTRCKGNFVVHALELYDHYVCGLCNPPSRAGRSRSLELAEHARTAVDSAIGDNALKVSSIGG
ncbi:DNA-binding transcriptional dual regulator with FlhD [Georgfuchsia toluolica]|uniref:Flagellar transcriptional regulator FlhC n=1 Tax=Georgfuchsia toluolica TaxID=424218 RepID=A0A916N124_9PROT|nr:flagellar transcriptional regulator FlhC [Georgfuchsia toluolica]CAG4882155.1 DNA-binding transcriptional dual regulator with FlhD [Georgfuchsia toluolica]